MRPVSDGLHLWVARGFLAWQVSLRVAAQASAWAFPRPSARASEKFANKTVNHSQIATMPINPAGASPLPRSAWIDNRSVVSRLPISTTNITGLRTICRGSNLKKASFNARRYNRACILRRDFFSGDIGSQSLRFNILIDHQVFNDRSQGQCGDKVQCTDD